MGHVDQQRQQSAFELDSGVLRLAEKIVKSASREHPADAVLRAELRAQRGLSREAGANVSKAVFAYFRWRGWLDSGKPISDQIEHALALNAGAKVTSAR